MEYEERHIAGPKLQIHGLAHLSPVGHNRQVWVLLVLCSLSLYAQREHGMLGNSAHHGSHVCNPRFGQVLLDNRGYI